MSRFARAAVGCLFVSPLLAGAAAFDFSKVDALAAGAINGANVTTAVPGFELLILKDGQAVFDKSYGRWANGQLANCDSATKTISGGVIMSLVDQSPQPFSLDTKLSTYLPGFTGDKQSITVRQCFSHTSGLAADDSIADGRITLQQSAAAIAQNPLQFTPGTTFSYGGTSMQAAGAASEVAGGASYKSLAQSRIFDKLGMTHSSFVLSGPNNPRVAGGVESNAADFGVYMDMLRGGGTYNGVAVLSPPSVQAMFTRQSPLNIPIANSPLDISDYGVGVWLDRRNSDGSLAQALAGGARGFCAWIDFRTGVVGVLSTDLTTFGNIENLQYLIRDATTAAVIPEPASCAAVAGLSLVALRRRPRGRSRRPAGACG